MTKTIPGALVAAMIAACTACGAMAQNVQTGTYLSPALTGSDFTGVLTGIVVNRPTLVFVQGINEICPDAAARIERAARSLPNLAVVIGKPSATSAFKDESRLMLYASGIDYRIVHPQTFGMFGFNACVYGDKLEDFLTARLAASNAVLEVHERIKSIEGEKKALERRIAEIEMIDYRGEAQRVEISQLFLRIEGLQNEAFDLREKIVRILNKDFDASRLRP